VIYGSSLYLPNCTDNTCGALQRSYLGGGMFMSEDRFTMPKQSKGKPHKDHTKGAALDDTGFNRERHFAFHRLSNFKAYAWLAAEQKHQLKAVYPGMYDLVKYLGECVRVRAGA
jgi:hypothetical protein